MGRQAQGQESPRGVSVPAPGRVGSLGAMDGDVGIEEVLATRADTGEEVYVRAASAPIVQNGQIIGAVAVNTDITHQKRVEQTLRDREERLRLILENIKDHAILSLDS